MYAKTRRQQIRGNTTAEGVRKEELVFRSFPCSNEDGQKLTRIARNCSFARKRKRKKLRRVNEYFGDVPYDEANERDNVLKEVMSEPSATR